MSFLKSTILFSLLALGTLSKVFTVTVSCQTCTIACGFTSCYRVTGDGYDKQTCGSESCSLAANITSNINTCTKDLLGTDCSTGLCYFLPGSGCASANLGATICSSTPYTIAASCTNCMNMPSCSKCIKFSAFGSSTQACYGSSCNGFTDVSASISSCAGGKDSTGNACTCCYTADSSLTDKAGVCTSSYSYFSSTEFNQYAKTKTTFETFLGAGIMALSLLTFLSL